jgi:hypothetical protein
VTKRVPASEKSDIQVEDYEPGLGCPHCKWAGYTPDERASHIEETHPGQYTGPTEEMLHIKDAAPGVPVTPNIFRDRRKK